MPGLQGLGPSWPSVLAALTSFSDVANTPFSAAIAYVESLGAHLLHSPATQPGLHMPVATAAFMPSPVLQQLSISGGYNAAAQSANSVGQFNFPAATAPFAPGQTSAQVGPVCPVSAGGRADLQLQHAFGWPAAAAMLTRVQTSFGALPSQGALTRSRMAAAKPHASSTTVAAVCTRPRQHWHCSPHAVCCCCGPATLDMPQAACRTTLLRQCWPCCVEPARPSSSSGCTS